MIFESIYRSGLLQTELLIESRQKELQFVSIELYVLDLDC